MDNSDKLQEIAERLVYTPRGYDAALNQNYCSASVHNDYGVGFHQCGKKATEQICGHGFCKSHAKIIKSRAGVLDDVVMYASGIDQYDNIYVVKVLDNGVRVATEGIVGKFPWQKEIKRETWYPTVEQAVAAVREQAREWAKNLEEKAESMRSALKSLDKDISERMGE